jgi:hypothetical protein
MPKAASRAGHPEGRARPARKASTGALRREKLRRRERGILRRHSPAYSSRRSRKRASGFMGLTSPGDFNRSMGRREPGL